MHTMETKSAHHTPSLYVLDMYVPAVEAGGKYILRFEMHFMVLNYTHSERRFEFH